MKKALIAAVALVAISSTANAGEAWPKWYLGLGVGLTAQSDSEVESRNDLGWDTGLGGSIALGYQPMTEGFRTELELSQRKQDVDNGNGEGKATALFVNAYYDFKNNSALTPYVGAGLGGARFELNKTNAANLSGKDLVASYQVMAGIGYEPTTLPNTVWSVGYRYFSPFQNPEAHGVEWDYDNHSVEVGARFKF